ncbi:MAG: plasmid mobilization relaxosome protein MobC, partial [Gemmiger sp.]
RTTIRPVLHVSSVNDELLSAVGKLTAEYGRIGGNLNQIARTLNEWHMAIGVSIRRMRTGN